MVDLILAAGLVILRFTLMFVGFSDFGILWMAAIARTQGRATASRAASVEDVHNKFAAAREGFSYDRI